VEEGNAFEAEAVQGVEDAEPPNVFEVTTRDVPEDDVPAEYLNNDKDVARKKRRRCTTKQGGASWMLQQICKT